MRYPKEQEFTHRYTAPTAGNRKQQDTGEADVKKMSSGPFFSEEPAL